MWLKWLRFIYGYVQFTAEGGFPERLLTEAANKGLQITDTCRQGERFFAACPAGQYRLLRPLARRACLRLKIQRKSGLYFRLFPYRKRFGLPIGILLSAVLLWGLSSRIWVVTVQSDVPVNQTEIIEAVAECGVFVGCNINNVDMQSLRIEALSALENLVYVSVNPSGCVARVTVNTRMPTPHIENFHNGCSNLVATRDGRIVKTEIYSGKGTVLVGEGVTAGTVLVSGTAESDKGNLTLRRAAGRIIAETEHTVSATIPFVEDIPTPDGKVIFRPVLQFLGIKIPLFANIPLHTAHTVETYHRLLNNGEFFLPIGLIDTRYITLQPQTVYRTREEAGALALQQLQKNIAALAKSGVTVKKELTRRVSETAETCTLTVTLLCEENIAKESPVKITE